jgi:hypothetical protein
MLYALGYDQGPDRKRRVAKREDSPLWLEARHNLEVESWASTAGGYMTGYYGKPFSDADALLLMQRQRNNFLKKTINDASTSYIFDLDPTYSGRYQNYMNNSYDTPEGFVGQIYTDLRYVKVPEELGFYESEQFRREAVAQAIHTDVITREFYEELDRISRERDRELEELGVKPDKDLVNAVYDKFSKEYTALYNSELYSGSPHSWTWGYKPGVEIYDQIADRIWKQVAATRPQYDASEGEYADWQKADQAWKDNLPELFEIAARNFFLTTLPKTGTRLNRNLPDATTAYGEEVDYIAIMTQLLSEASWDTYDAWRKSKHSPIEAMNEAYKTLVWDPFLQGRNDIQDNTWARGVYDNAEFSKPQVSNKTLMQWVIDNYEPGQFTLEQLQQIALGTIDVPSLEEVNNYGDEAEKIQQRSYDILMWAGPGSVKMNELKAAFVSLGGDTGDFDTWYNTDGKWGTIDDYSVRQSASKFVTLLDQAAQKIGLTEPSPEIMEEMAGAKEKQKEFRSMVERQNGADFWDIQNEYYSLDYANQKMFRTNRPEDYQKVKEYGTMKDIFSAMPGNEIWTKYFNPAYMAAGSGGSGGGGGGGGGYAYKMVPTKMMVPKKYDSGLLSSATPMGRRGDLKVLGSAGNVPWPAGFSKLIGPVAMEEITVMIKTKVPLSAKTQQFLSGVAARNPKYAAVIEGIQNYVPATGSTMAPVRATMK